MTRTLNNLIRSACKRTREISAASGSTVARTTRVGP